VNPRTRLAALYAIGIVAILASGNALAHSYAGLYDWASTHRLNAWQSLSWPAEIDVFLVIGELALYVAYLDGWSGRHKIWPWITTILGLIVSIVGNIGHIQPLPGQPVTIADRLTAATSPLAAFSGLTIGLLVLKMTRQRALPKEWTAITPAGLILASRLFADRMIPRRPDCPDAPGAMHESETDRSGDLLLSDASQILEDARARGDQVSQRYLAAQLRIRGHRFPNAQLGLIAGAIGLTPERRAAEPPTQVTADWMLR
jgi:hypothetical protein